MVGTRHCLNWLLVTKKATSQAKCDCFALVLCTNETQCQKLGKRDGQNWARPGCLRHSAFSVPGLFLGASNKHMRPVANGACQMVKEGWSSDEGWQGG